MRHRLTCAGFCSLGSRLSCPVFFLAVFLTDAAFGQTVIRLPGFLPDTDKYSKDQGNRAFLWRYPDPYAADPDNPYYSA